MEFEGRTALITGGAMGIGFACAEMIVARGGSVVIADILKDEGRAARDALGERAHFVQTDVEDLASVEAAAAAAEERFGSLDILVTCAARALSGVVDEIAEDRWSTVINTNLSGAWRAMKASVPYMRRQGRGSVVNMSSVQGLLGFKGWSAYSAAKGGLDALTRQSAVDLAPHGIRVNAVLPGTIMTPMNEKIFAEMEDPSELIETWNRAHPIGRFGYPAEVAEAVTFLASDRASFITGETLRVDGGLAVRAE